jgi:cytochrome c oxidase subunit III
VSNAVAHEEPTVLMQFDDMQQQDDSTKLGMWTFLSTEVMFFGGMFLAYILFRWKYHSGFAEGSNALIIWAGFINTGVLLVSSLTMAIAVDEAKLGNPKAVVRYLLITLALGSIFLLVKAYEYTTDYFELLIPGLGFAPEHIIHKLHEVGRPEELAHVQLFFVIYFAMTGMHALHMVIGIATLSVLAYLIHKNKFNDPATVESIGLYWHFVDLVWVFLFPLLYLIDLSHK